MPEDGPSALVPPLITREPSNQQLSVGRTAAFSVTATGTAPLSYLWQKNGEPIGGATASSYTTPPITLSDNGALFRCIVSNAAGADTSAPALLTVTTGVVPDQFNSIALNTSLWTFVNPLGDVDLAMTGTQLALTLPPGVSHDIWTYGNFAPRIMQHATNADFTVEVKFDAPLTQRYQMQGVIVQQDASKYLRCEIHHDGYGVKVYAAGFTNGTPVTLGYVAMGGGSPSYFRVRRLADQWTLSYSSNGTSWTQAFTFNFSLIVSSLGPFAANHGTPGSNSPGWTALFDYFVSVSPGGAPDGDAIAASLEKPSVEVPDRVALVGNYPNPFNPSTTIKYTVGGAGGWGTGTSEISLIVYDVLGREVALLVNERMPAGVYEARFNGAGLASGIYLCRMIATSATGEHFVATRRLMLMK